MAKQEQQLEQYTGPVRRHGGFDRGFLLRRVDPVIAEEYGPYLVTLGRTPNLVLKDRGKNPITVTVNTRVLETRGTELTMTDEGQILGPNEQVRIIGRFRL